MNSLPSNDRFGEEELERADALRKQADDIGAARSALDSAASMARGLWISFISLSAYLAIAVGSVTHRMLFLEEPLQLPIINIKLPMVAFFWITPILFLVLHAYLLLHLKFTGDNIREWERLAKRGLRAVPDDEGKAIEDSLRMQLPNFLLVQMLVPPKANRKGIVYSALTATVLITVIVGPVLLLSLIQLQFLPYHNWAVTWVHRLLIVADLGLIGLLWPLVLGHPIKSWCIATRLATFGSAIGILWLSVVIATFPGEGMYQSSGLGIQMLRSYLFEGGINQVSGRPNSWFSNRLVLTDQHFVDLGDDALKNVETTLSFRGRHLERAVFIHADLRKADFSGAFMDEAVFVAAKLAAADFGCSVTGMNDDQFPISNCTQLQNASFDLADLQDARFGGAELQGATFFEADLQDADFNSASLQGAYFDGAHFQGANLSHAELQGASLLGANLKGAILSDAWLQGAFLVGAQLQGATLDNAQLQGALLDKSDFQGASLRGAFVWRARGFKSENFKSADLYNLLLAGAYGTITEALVNFDDAGYKRFVLQTTNGIISQETRDDVKDSLNFLDPAYQDSKIPTEKDAKEFWEDLQAAYDVKDRASYLGVLSCRNDAAPFLTRTLIEGNMVVGAVGGMGEEQSRRIAIHILDGLEAATCPGAIGIGDDAMVQLHSLAPDWKPENTRTLSGNLRRFAAVFRALLDPVLFVAEDILQ